MEQQPAPDSVISHLGPGPALVFALNPGEELAGCAGAVFAHRAKNEPVTVVLFCDGTPDAPETAAPVLTPSLARIRAAALEFGYPQPLCWHLRRRDFGDGEALTTRVMGAIRESGACLVYAPAAAEIHPLRQLATMAVQEAVYRTGGRLWLAQYPVEQAMSANRLLDIRPYCHAKAAISQQFVARDSTHGPLAQAESALSEPFLLRAANELQAENRLELYAARSAAAASQVKLGEVYARLQQLDRQLADARAVQARLQQEQGRQERQFADAMVHVSNLEDVIAHLRADSSAMRQSRSWRLTRLFRAVARLSRPFREGRPVSLPATVEPPATPGRSEYERWIDRYEQLEPAQLAELCANIASWPQPPLLSILMPVYDTPEPWLRRAIDSVLAQSYPHWELCIADDASPSRHVQAVLQEYQRRDRRIKLVNRPENGHIAAASNSALELAEGEFLCLLDHDDKLAPHALYLMASAIRAYPDKDLFYSDEDKIDAEGRRFEPYFKPDWNPDLFLSYNFFNHFGAFRTCLVRELGGFRVGYEGAEDYDLVLRAISRVGHAKIHHIPHVLYHWGVVPGSAAVSHAEKPYALPAAIRAVSEHLADQHIYAEVTESSPGTGTLRVRYALPDPPPRVSIIIATRDGYALLRQCLDSIYSKTTYLNFEVLVVDNGSEDPLVLDYLQTLQASRGVRVLRDERPFNYPALNNAAARQAEGELLCLMNNDVEVISRDWLGEMASQALRPDIGIVGCRLWYPDDTLQHAGVILGLGGVAGHAHHRLDRTQRGYFSRAQLVQNYSAITSACAVVRASVFWEVGGFNERLAVAFNDTDLCVRIRNAGYRNLWTPYAELYHCESASRGYEDTREKKERFEREKAIMRQYHGDTLLNDPAYNPNLALERQDYTLAYPPRINVLGVG